MGSTNTARSEGAFARDVADRFGVLPNFFLSTPAAPGVMEDLWRFTKSAYLDCPLPSLFKERLFVHLSRFCEVRYCIVRHVGFLLGEGRPAGDPAATPHTLEQALTLLNRPIPDAAALEQLFQRLEAHAQLEEPPAPETQDERDLFDALTVMFVAPRRSARARAGVRRLMGDRTFEILTAFLAFARTAHYWTQLHPELTEEPDMLARMQRDPELARLLNDTSEAERANGGEELRKALDELQRAQGSLRATEDRFDVLADLLPVLVWRSDPSGTKHSSYKGWTEYTGQTPEQARSDAWLEAIHPDDREITRDTFRMGLEERRGIELQHRVRRHDGQYRWFLVRRTPITDAQGRITEWFGAAVDIDDLRRLQERQSVLVAELQHRTRNLLGVVMSICDRMIESSRSLDDFKARFRDRLAALARVNGLLSRLGEGDRITFDELIGTELAGLGVVGQGEQVRLDGPPGVRLRSFTVQTLALGLHELATNAIKYGALSRPEGRLVVRWRLLREGGQERRLQVRWRESGAPIPASARRPSSHRGYGRELIERALPYQLNAETEYDLAPDGVRCTITLPIPGDGRAQP